MRKGLLNAEEIADKDHGVLAIILKRAEKMLPLVATKLPSLLVVLILSCTGWALQIIVI